MKLIQLQDRKICDYRSRQKKGGIKGFLFNRTKVSINAAARYLRMDIPVYRLFFYREYALSLKGRILSSGKLWNIFSFANPLFISSSIPIRGFKTTNDDYAVELSRGSRSIILRPKVSWILSGKFKHVSLGLIATYRWKLNGDPELIRKKSTTPWNLLSFSTSTRRRLLGTKGFKRRRLAKLIRDSAFSSERKLTFLGNSKSVDPSSLDTLPRCFDIVAFNRFVSSYTSHKLRENLLISADKQMINDYGSEMRNKASNGLLLLSGPLRKDKCSSLHIRRELRETNTLKSDLGNSIQTFSSSPIVGLQVCLSLNPKQILFYGLDMSFPTNLKASESGRGFKTGEGNHFLPDYRSGKKWFEPNWERILTGFFFFSLVSENLGIKLLNLTPANHVPLKAEHVRSFEGLEYCECSR